MCFDLEEISKQNTILFFCGVNWFLILDIIINRILHVLSPKLHFGLI